MNKLAATGYALAFGAYAIQIGGWIVRGEFGLWQGVITALILIAGVCLVADALRRRPR